MSQTFDNSEDVLRACRGKSGAALVVLCDVTGGTLRARGAIMAVTSSETFGYISNGCVDADIIARARAGEAGQFIYGQGSPFRDITLPCGGRLDIAIVQNPDQAAIETALSKLDNREETELRLGDITVSLSPPLRLRIAGRGAACLALADLARQSGFDVSVQSPDTDISPDVQHLTNPDQPPAVRDDSRTAFICLFHDHDWEVALLEQALAGPVFYIGAMGSVRTHEIRRRRLSGAGISEGQISRIHGPIGLVAAQRNASLLAISILAEIIQAAQQAKLL